MLVDVAAQTDRGRVRGQNEDSYLVAQLGQTSRIREVSESALEGQKAEREVLLFLVADGMGGEGNGDLASKIVVEQLAEFARRSTSSIFAATHDNGAMGNLLCGELERCHTILKRAAEPTAVARGMGSTATLALVSWPKVFLAHVGDSRCYLLRDGQLLQLTHDHSMAQYLVDQGYLSTAQAEDSQLRHQLWNALGGKGTDVKVDFHEVRLVEGDVMLLCSDGLTGSVHDGDLEKQLRSNRGASEVCNQLVAAANTAGGKDNITCVVARFAAANTAAAVARYSDSIDWCGQNASAT